MDVEHQLQQDVCLMQECIRLARLTEGRTAPNPMVGAVITDAAGSIIGRGYHPAAGLPHAEVLAFEEAGERAAGGTLYVSLEPCCHYGRTPPCLDGVLASGVSRVVIGMTDPNPKVAGKSVVALQAAGIATTVGVCESECRWLNRGFIKRMTEGLPWVALKLAVTMDGRIADRTGRSKWISGGAARRYVHELRNTLDAVMVGPGTVRTDDPELTVRDIDNGRNPFRVVWDPLLSYAGASRLCKSAEGSVAPPTLILCKSELAERHQGEFAPHVQLVGIDTEDSDDRTRLPSLREALMALMKHDINTVLCEGGGKFAASLLAEQLIDEVHWIVAPKFLVDGQAMAALEGRVATGLPDCVMIENQQVKLLDNDVLISGRIAYR